MLKEKTASQEHYSQQSCPLEVKENKNFPTQAKAKGVHHHQNCPIRNPKKILTQVETERYQATT